MAGSWMKCGFLDGEKMLCMDNLYRAITNETCLVYSFGLADDWDFEILMAELGKSKTPWDMDGTLKLIFTNSKTTWDFVTKFSVFSQLRKL